MVHHQDFTLAESVLRDLIHLRSCANAANSNEVRDVARKVAISSSVRYQGSADVDHARTDAWLAICKLVGLSEHRPIETDAQWEEAIDLTVFWARAAK